MSVKKTILFSWSSIKKILSNPVFRYSPSLILGVPLISSTKYAMCIPKSDKSADIVYSLFGKCDDLSNIVYLFYASLCVFVANCVASAFCPKIIDYYKGYDDWRKNDSKALQQESIILTNHGLDYKYTDRDMSEYYRDQKLKKDVWFFPIRFLILFLLAMAVIMTVIFLYNNLMVALSV